MSQLEKSRKVLFEHSARIKLPASLLPSATPDIVKSLIEVLPSDVLKVLGFGVGFGPDVKISRSRLEARSRSAVLTTADSPYLLGDKPTLADLAVAGLSMLLKFPDGPYLDLPRRSEVKEYPD